MKIEIVRFHGWDNNLRVSNSLAELLVTLDVGPRVLVYKTFHGSDVFKLYEEQLGGAMEPDWKIRGGHRLWLGPEDEVLSYHKDNKPASYRKDPDTGELLIESVQTEPQRIRKILGIKMAEIGSHVTVRHLAVNEGTEPITFSTWGLSVMAPGGVEIIPQPPLGEHPRDLLPNRGVVVWPYTDFSDPRWKFGRKYWLLRQAEGFLPTKIGLIHREGWIAYLLNDTLFIKTIEHDEDAVYPDGGCNFETFTNTDMLEIESLGPLTTLEPGEATGHTEHWHLFHVNQQVDVEDEENLAAWLDPLLEKVAQHSARV